MTQLRDFQVQLENDIYAAWSAGARNVIATAPTGAGKTVLFSSIILKLNVPTCAVCHRQELVAQISLALNRERVPHSVIAPKALRQQIISLHHSTHGYTKYTANARVRVASVDTFINHSVADKWLQTVQLLVIDEGHHVTKGSKWHTAAAMFPQARGLLMTAHALRADGLGLGSESDGIADALVIGPHCRALINRGYLTDYRAFCPPTDIDFSRVEIGSTGDYSLPQLRAATHKSSHLVGDVVAHYQRLAGGKLGVTFAVDVESAKELAAAYRGAGVPAEIITANTPIPVRASIMQRFRKRELLQLVSVDVLSEGTDVPAIEVVSLARKTASFQVFAQQTGRALRIMVSDELNAQWGTFTDAQRLAHIAASAKPHAIIIDHVGNFGYHGLPDAKQEYTLARRESRGRRKSDVMSLRTCLQCLQPFEAHLVVCPYCAAPIPAPTGRGSPEQVGGDLIELDPAVLQALRGEIARVDGPVRIPAGATPPIRSAIQRRHNERSAAQQSLRAAMALWGGWRCSVGELDREAQRRFYLQFGVDVLSAQALGVPDAAALEARVRSALESANVTEVSG